MIDIWTIPLILVILLICAIGYGATRKGAEAAPNREGRDRAVPNAVQQHPFTLNPVMWVIFIFLLFMGIVIFYYSASSY